MIERKTLLGQVEVSRHGHMGVRLDLVLTENGKEIDCKFHRTAMILESDPQLQMLAVNIHLSEMDPPMPPVSDADLKKVCALFDLFKVVNDV